MNPMKRMIQRILFLTICWVAVTSQFAEVAFARDNSDPHLDNMAAQMAALEAKAEEARLAGHDEEGYILF